MAGKFDLLETINTNYKKGNSQPLLVLNEKLIVVAPNGKGIYAAWVFEILLLDLLSVAE